MIQLIHFKRKLETNEQCSELLILSLCIFKAGFLIDIYIYIYIQAVLWSRAKLFFVFVTKLWLYSIGMYSTIEYIKQTVGNFARKERLLVGFHQFVFFFSPNKR